MNGVRRLRRAHEVRVIVDQARNHRAAAEIDRSEYMFLCG